MNEETTLTMNEETTLTDEFMLTTIDNPFNPFEQFTSWFLYDVEKGYNTCSYLARIAKISDEFSEKENNEEIIKYDFMGIYKKVKRNGNDNSHSAINNDSNEIESDNVTI